jgi:hypothetical protein
MILTLFQQMIWIKQHENNENPAVALPLFKQEHKK